VKTILIFIGLKLTEIMAVCGVIAITYFIGYFVDPWLTKILYKDIYPDIRPYERYHSLCFLVGLFVYCFLIVIGIAGYGICAGVKANWNWAKRISKK
jgi:hypothetical protein